MRFSQRDLGYGFCHFALRCVIGALCIGFSLVGAAWAQSPFQPRGPATPPPAVTPPAAGDASVTTAVKQSAVAFFDFKTNAVPTSTLGVATDKLTAGVANNELKGRVYLPSTTLTPGAAYPVVVFLHGVHGVCGRPYTPLADPLTGERPAGVDFRAVDPPGLNFTKGATLPPTLITEPEGFYCPPGGQTRAGMPDLICPQGAGTGPGGTYLPRTCPPPVAANKTGPDGMEFPKALTWMEVPSYQGYDYLAKRLASQGYICLSVNANLIQQEQLEAQKGKAPTPWALPYLDTDKDRILERGQLVLQHLVQFHNWNSGTTALPGGTKTNAGTPLATNFLQGHLDLTQVGLVGHSRGGEGVRAAYYLYTNSLDYTTKKGDAVPGGKNWIGMFGTKALGIKAIYEIAPTDSQADNVKAVALNAVGTAWNVLLPQCDGDTKFNDGIRPFDRMMAMGQTETTQSPKSVYTVWGANHNFFNTQWQLTDTGEFNHEFWSWTPGRCKVAPPGLAPPVIAVGANAINPRLSKVDVDAAVPPIGQTTAPDPGAVRQRATALSSVTALILANVGVGSKVVPAANQALNRNFNPLFRTPTMVTDETLTAGRAYPPQLFVNIENDNGPITTAMATARIERSYISAVDQSQFLVVDDFSNKAGIGMSSNNVPNTNMNFMGASIETRPVNHDAGQKAALLTWNASAKGSPTPFLETNLTAVGSGKNLAKDYPALAPLTTLQFRVGRAC